MYGFFVVVVVVVYVCVCVCVCACVWGIVFTLHVAGNTEVSNLKVSV